MCINNTLLKKKNNKHSQVIDVTDYDFLNDDSEDENERNLFSNNVGMASYAGHFLDWQQIAKQIVMQRWEKQQAARQHLGTYFVCVCVCEWTQYDGYFPFCVFFVGIQEK